MFLICKLFLTIRRSLSTAWQKRYTRVKCPRGWVMLTPRFSCVFLLFALSGIAVAQHGRPASGSPNSAVPPFSSGTISSPSTQSEIFISGKVVLDDGTELTEPAVIQTICRGRRHSETYSDTHGSFSFRFGDPTQGSAAAISDASSSNVNNNGMGTQSRQDLQDCQIQAELAGFSSQPVELNTRIGLTSSIDVGRVPLHRLAHVEGTSISVTSALAPPAARKAFEKGLEQEKKNKWEDAQKSFEKAVQIYPRYATAWYQLGRLQLRNQLSGPSPAQNPSCNQPSIHLNNRLPRMRSTSILTTGWHRSPCRRRSGPT